MKKTAIYTSVVALAFMLTASVALAAKPANKGFDEFGYNDTARNFVGTGMSWCMGKVGNQSWCEGYLGAYANDKLNMKWNEAWDKCNDAGNNSVEACLGAWTTNHWNGSMGETDANWFYKIIWVGADGESSPYWIDGGYSIWGSYEVITDQGKDPSYGEGHIVFAKGIPNGLGFAK